MIWKHVESYVEFAEKIDPMADVARTLNLLGVTFGQTNISTLAITQLALTRSCYSHIPQE